MNGYPQQTSTLAIISMICGALSFFLGLVFAFVFPCLGPLVGGASALAAVVLGHLGRAEIANAEGAMEGDGMALTGLILGYIFIVGAVLLTILVVILVFILGVAFLGIASSAAASAAAPVTAINCVFGGVGWL